MPARESWLRWGAATAPLVLFGLLAAFGLGPTPNRAVQALLVLAGLALGIAASWLADRTLALLARQRELEGRLAQQTDAAQRLHARLALLGRLNHAMVDASDEHTLMEQTLASLGELTGAAGMSYTPLDEWGQPLATVQQGDVPTAQLEHWSDALRDTTLRETCRACTALHAEPGAPCPLANHPYGRRSAIHCLSVRRGDQVLGLVNLYLPDGGVVDDDLRQFLEEVLSEVAFAIELLRLRGQEIATLRQLQMLRGLRMDLPDALSRLLSDAQRALEVDYVYLELRGVGKLPALTLQGKGLAGEISEAELQSIVQQAIRGNQLVSQVAAIDQALPGRLGAVLAAPLSLPDAPAFGVLLVANTRAQAFYPRQQRVLETIAGQAARLVDGERQMMEMQYRAVMEERTRLAREIHDGLAQTLAFLKMQVSQMQNLLAREDTSRLREMIRTSHRTLSEAYLDVRHAIDNLRVSPQNGVRHWLEQAVNDFQKATKLDIRLELEPETFEPDEEIQAQLIRVVQEALSNVRKHAHASAVLISLRSWNDDLILEITDDGQGFSPEDVPYISQYGLRGMRERAEMIGADFQIVSQPNQGTVVRLRLPNPIEETPV